jgi:hypothetical protein
MEPPSPESPTQQASKSVKRMGVGMVPTAGPHDRLFISISGLIGAGKTTLCTALAKVMNLPAFYEVSKGNGVMWCGVSECVSE